MGDITKSVEKEEVKENRLTIFIQDSGVEIVVKSMCYLCKNYVAEIFTDIYFNGVMEKGNKRAIQNIPCYQTNL